MANECASTLLSLFFVFWVYTLRSKSRLRSQFAVKILQHPPIRTFEKCFYRIATLDVHEHLFWGRTGPQMVTRVFRHDSSAVRSILRDVSENLIERFEIVKRPFSRTNRSVCALGPVFHHTHVCASVHTNLHVHLNHRSSLYCHKRHITELRYFLRFVNQKKKRNYTPHLIKLYSPRCYGNFSNWDRKKCAFWRLFRHTHTRCAIERRISVGNARKKKKKKLFVSLPRRA